MNKSETQKYVQELQKRIKALETENSELHCEIQTISALPDNKYAEELEENNTRLQEELMRKCQTIKDMDDEVVYLKKQLYGENYNHKKYVTKVEELKEQILELESELSVKENLLKIKNGLCQEKPRIHIIGLREFGGEQYMRYSDVEELIKELENQ